MPRILLPPLLARHPFALGDGLDDGLSEKRLRGSDLAAPHSGVRVARSAESALEHAGELYLPLLRPDEVFSHTTAASIWGLPLPLAVSPVVHVTRFGEQRPRRPAVVGHRSSRRLATTIVGGLPVVEPLVAWAQCAAVLRLDDLVAMGDALAGRWSPHAAARELPLGLPARAADDWGRRRGRRRLEEALGLVRPDVWSPRETALRLVILRAGLPEPPERNAVICDAAGSVVGHADLVWRDERVLAEYEGDQHRTDRRQWRLDLAKYEAYADEGWRVVRVTDDDLVAPARLVRRIARLLTDRAVLC
ncbi:hypothetical protein [Frondihabitans peucedani]|uniref:DUF559 domain-containing protein n=1 Tax=Frondihabitans peucedani TaxID=598626 RepID=A0ABP8E1S6_9MICO